MTQYQLTISQIKSELLDLWIDTPGVQSYSDWYELLKPKLQAYFQIEESDFFVYSQARKCFIPIQGHKLALKERHSITYDWLKEHPKKYCIQQLNEMGFGNADDFIIFKDKQANPLAMLLIQSTISWRDFASTVYFHEFEKAVSGFIKSIYHVSSLAMNEKKFRLLFNVTESFNSTMASEMILDHVLETMGETFPTFKTELILSREPNGMNYPYKIFNQIKEKPSTIEAFLYGKVTTEYQPDSGVTIMNAPLKGRQGIYGVLLVKTPDGIIFSPTQKSLVRMLASTAGNALENASLYDQSHRLIDDLQLVNEASRKLNSGLHFEEMVSYLNQKLTRAFSPNEMAFIFYNDKEEYEILEASSNFFVEIEGRQYIQNVSEYIQVEKESLFNADYSNTVNNVPYKSVIGIPIVNQEELIGFVLCLHAEKYFFSFDSFKLMRSLISHASLAISNLQLRDKLQELAEKDHLTGLYARRYLDRHIEKIIEAKQGGTFLLMDVDDFKLVNDKYGHDIGDKVLKQIGTYIMKELNSTGIAARWGGEEFAVYLPETYHRYAETLSRKLLSTIPIITNPPVTVSMGSVYWDPVVIEDFKILFKNADLALYQAKRQGKNRIISKTFANNGII